VCEHQPFWVIGNVMFKYAWGMSFRAIPNLTIRFWGLKTSKVDPFQSGSPPKHIYLLSLGTDENPNAERSDFGGLKVVVQLRPRGTKEPSVNFERLIALVQYEAPQLEVGL